MRNWSGLFNFICFALSLSFAISLFCFILLFLDVLIVLLFILLILDLLFIFVLVDYDWYFLTCWSLLNWKLFFVLLIFWLLILSCFKFHVCLLSEISLQSFILLKLWSFSIWSFSSSWITTCYRTIFNNFFLFLIVVVFLFIITIVWLIRFFLLWFHILCWTLLFRLIFFYIFIFNPLRLFVSWHLD